MHSDRRSVRGHVLERILSEFSTQESVSWERYEDIAQRKLEANPGVIEDFNFGHATQQLLYELNAAPSFCGSSKR